MKKYFWRSIIISIILILPGFISCERDDEVAWVMIRGEMIYYADIEFFPTESANGYKLEATLDPLSSNNGVDVYHSDDENIQPHILLSQGYDSIIIRIDNPEKDVIYLGKNMEEPTYKFNPFIDPDAWEYVKLTEDFPTNTAMNTTTIHAHIFKVRVEDIIR